MATIVLTVVLVIFSGFVCVVLISRRRQVISSSFYEICPVIVKDGYAKKDVFSVVVTDPETKQKMFFVDAEYFDLLRNKHPMLDLECYTVPFSRLKSVSNILYDGISIVV